MLSWRPWANSAIMVFYLSYCSILNIIVWLSDNATELLNYLDVIFRTAKLIK